MGIVRRPRSAKVLKGLLAGVVAGLAASVVMTESQKGWSKASEAFKSGAAKEGNQNQANAQGEDATIKAASKLASLTGHELAPEQKTKAGSMVHYGFGALMGALYGMAMELIPRRYRKLHPALCGASFGSALFVAAHEIAVPSLGLSRSPAEEALADHLREWVLHLAYGESCEATRRLLRRRL